MFARNVTLHLKANTAAEFTRMLEQCACGHRALVERRSGKREEPGEPKS